jgi:phospholipase D1/2
VFPGQDYNNARVYDFEDVDKWENNKRAYPRTPVVFQRLLTDAVDRTKSSRMGWSDISISLSGPILDSLAIHFTQRW